MRLSINLHSRAAARLAAAAGAALFLALIAAARPGPPAGLPCRSPFDAAFSPDGRRLAVTDRTAGQVVLLDAAGRAARRIALPEPTGLAWHGPHLYAADYATGAVAEIEAATGRVLRRLPVGPRPLGLALAPSRGLLLAACAATRCVSVVDLASGGERARIPCPGEPFAVVVAPGGNLAVVGNLTPGYDASDPRNASALSLLDLSRLKRVADIRLPAGAVNVRGLAVSPDGRWAYAAHALGRFNLPTTQLDRGWINTNALSIVDLRARRHYATVLLDHPAEGAADPWGMALSKDGRTLWITLSGVHQLARLDLARLHPLLEGRLPADSPLAKASAEYGASARCAWVEIKEDPARRADLVNDLTALHVADLIEKTPLPGIGPRGLALSPDGRRLAAALYFSGSVALISPVTGKAAAVSLGPSRPPDAARTGERMFHDATLCFQHWLSCATCHPDGRADGLNWDLLNDGLGNPKNTRSLLLAHRRTPVMSHGVRADYRVATLAGFRFIEFREPQPGEATAVEAYIASLKPQPSPYRVRGALSARAQRGKRLFESARTKCASCHKGPLFSDQRLYDVGTRAVTDSSGKFITSTLVEVWRTAPYLHDGRAVTMRDLLTAHNRNDKHGVTSHLSPAQVEDLAEYVLSL